MFLGYSQRETKFFESYTRLLMLHLKEFGHLLSFYTKLNGRKFHYKQMALQAWGEELPKEMPPTVYPHEPN